MKRLEIQIYIAKQLNRCTASRKKKTSKSKWIRITGNEANVALLFFLLASSFLHLALSLRKNVWRNPAMFYLFLLLHVALCTRRSTWCHNKTYRIQKGCNFWGKCCKFTYIKKPIPLNVHPPKTKTEAENHISQTSMFGFHVSFQVCKSSKNATSLSADSHLFGERFSVSVNPLDPIDGVGSLHSSTFYIMPMHIKSTEFTVEIPFSKAFPIYIWTLQLSRLFFHSKETAPQPTSPIHDGQGKKQFHQPSIPILEIQSKMQSRASCITKTG